MAYLQQDAFDKVDATVPLERQKLIFGKIYDIAVRDYDFKDKASARAHFTKLTGLFKNFHYTAEKSPAYGGLLGQIDRLLSGAADDQGTGREKTADLHQGGQNDVA